MKGTESEGQGEAAAAKLIDARIKELGDWRGALLARVRALIKQADAEVVEEWKWCGVSGCALVSFVEQSVIWGGGCWCICGDERRGIFCDKIFIYLENNEVA